MKILIAGDYCPKDRLSSIYGSDSYINTINSIKNIVGSADYSIVNLECPIPNAPCKAIDKNGPCLKATFHALDFIKQAGFSAVSLANNHFRDYGDIGVSGTIDSLDKEGIEHVGGGRDLEEARRVLYKSFESESIAIINCCESEFSVASENCGGSNPINAIQQWYSIKEAKEKSDYVIVITHGGHEHYQLPSPRMQELYRFFIDAGADAVVNHHQHCYSGFEYYKGKPIVYGLGNFYFDWKGKRGLKWNEGYMVCLSFSKTQIDLKTIPYTQCDVQPVISLIDNRQSFDSRINELNLIISDPEKLKKCHQDYMKSQIISMRLPLLPYSNKYLLAAANRGLLPRFLTKKKLLRLWDYVNCESHLDSFRYFVNNELLR